MPCTAVRSLDCMRHSRLGSGGINASSSAIGYVKRLSRHSWLANIVVWRAWHLIVTGWQVIILSGTRKTTICFFVVEVSAVRSDHKAL